MTKLTKGFDLTKNNLCGFVPTQLSALSNAVASFSIMEGNEGLGEYCPTPSPSQAPTIFCSDNVFVFSSRPLHSHDTTHYAGRWMHKVCKGDVQRSAGRGGLHCVPGGQGVHRHGSKRVRAVPNVSQHSSLKYNSFFTSLLFF